MGIHKADNTFQVFATNQNENIYTNLWHGPYYGFERVIETYELTEKPYRFKAVNIYYHSYSGTKVASLRALRKVYDYVLHAAAAADPFHRLRAQGHRLAGHGRGARAGRGREW